MYYWILFIHGHYLCVKSTLTISGGLQLRRRSIRQSSSIYPPGEDGYLWIMNDMNHKSYRISSFLFFMYCRHKPTAEYIFKFWPLFYSLAQSCCLFEWQQKHKKKLLFFAQMSSLHRHTNKEYIYLEVTKRRNTAFSSCLAGCNQSECLPTVVRKNLSFQEQTFLGFSILNWGLDSSRLSSPGFQFKEPLIAYLWKFM